MSSADKSKTFGVMKQLYPDAPGAGAEKKNNQTVVDIVAVHGLNGHCENTFTRKGHFWLKDSLPVWIPQSRIFTYGYNSDVFIQSNSNLSDWSQKLLSSLESKRKGNPDALIEAKINPKFEKIRTSVSAIFFLGTPQQGSEIADFASVLVSIAHAATGKLRPELLKILKQNSPKLQELTQQFRHHSGHFKIFSFYEQQPTHGKIIVDKTSALSNLEHEEQFPVEASHTEICRFAEDEEEYDLATTLHEQLSNVFEKIVENTALVQQKIFELSILKALMPEDDINTPANVATPYAGTCSWILQHPKYQAWLKDSLRSLWIQGGPGCGKSVLSSFLIQRLSEDSGLRPSTSEEPSTGEGPKTIVAGFFCSDKDDNRRTSTWILRSLLHQAFTQNRNLLKHALHWYQQSEGWDSQSETADLDAAGHEEIWGSFERLRSILIAIKSDPEVKEIYFVVDGLDQCGHAAWDFLSLIGSTDAASIRCVISSRPNEFVQRKLEHPYIIDLAKENRLDINTVIAARMKRLQEFRGFSSSLCQTIEGILKDRSGGMFLWVCLALDRLNEWVGITGGGAVENMLRNMPSSLNAVYEEVLTRVSDQGDKEVTARLNQMLMWSYFAKRSMKLDEMQIILFLKPSDRSESQVQERFTKNYQDSEEFQKAISDLCGPLVTIQDDGTILLAHQSVRDFLSQLYNEDNQTSKFAMSSGDAHAEMARACIAYLSLGDIYKHKVPPPPLDQNGWIDSSQHQATVEEYLRGHNFLEYSILYLGDHLRALRECGPDVMRNFDKFFSDGSDPLKNWAHAYDLIKRWTQGKYTGSSSTVAFLPVASRLNLTWLAEKSASAKGLTESLLAKLNFPDSLGWLPIHLAVDSEAVEMLEWLLEKGSSVNIPVTEPKRAGLTALHIAAAKRSENGLRMVEMLLDKKAKVNAETLTGNNTPLHSAIEGRSVATVKRLLEAGASLNSTNSKGLTALHKAVSVAGLHEIVKVLLDHDGADVEGKTSRAAATAYREAITLKASPFSAKQMMSTARDFAGSVTPLYLAAQSAGTEKTLAVLLGKKANPSAKDGQGRTALHIVAQGASSKSSGAENKEKAVLLLKAGAKVNATDGKEQTPLHKAVSPPARQEVLEVLLGQDGCDVNARDNKQRTPLLLFLETVSHHFDAKSRPAKPDTSETTETQEGEEQAQSNFDRGFLESIFDRLIAAGADIEAKDKDKKSAAYYANQPGLAWVSAKLAPGSPQPIEDIQTQQKKGLMGGARDIMTSSFSRPKVPKSTSEPVAAEVAEIAPPPSPQPAASPLDGSKAGIGISMKMLTRPFSRSKATKPKSEVADKPEKKSKRIRHSLIPSFHSKKSPKPGVDENEN